MSTSSRIFWVEPDFQTLTNFRPRTIKSVVSFVNDQWVFKITVDPGYPDHSGIKVLFEGTGDTVSDAFIKSEEIYNRELK